MNHQVSRRDFLKIGALGTFGGLVAYSTLPYLISQAKTRDGKSQLIPAPKPASSIRQDQHWGFICDTEKCIGCGKCVVACKLENKVPWEPEYNRTWVERYIITDDDKVYVDSPNAGRDGFTADYMNEKYKGLNIQKSFFVPKLCNHCDNPPCVTVCPVGATYKSADGVVLVDQEHCIGCRYCVQACPYGARYVLPNFSQTNFGQVRVVDKCTWCYHRINKGLLPACVEACPVEARVFGDLKDPQSAVSRILAEKRVDVLKPELGTEPKVYYIGIEKGVY